ncbi:MAG: hypothetical protein WCK73_18365, partial [Deltaproteobacteria bacterium]
MFLKTSLAVAAILLASPTLAEDQARKQTRDPATHVDGATPTQQRDRINDATVHGAAALTGGVLGGVL